MRALVVLAGVLVLVVLSGCVATPDSTIEQPSETALSFSEVSAEAGLEYASSEGGAGNGNDGVYIADYNNNLREDVLVIGAEEPGEEPVLFTNTGDGFERSDALPNVSAQKPADSRIQSALWVDHDNDGWEDLVLFPRGETPIFLENDEGTFEHRDVGLETTLKNPVGASAADFDGDGCLDLFIIQYGQWSDSSPKAWHNAAFEQDNGEPNVLYRGSCGDGFERVDDAGIESGDRGAHWSMATSFADLTGNGHPDIHVANDYYNDSLYYNQGDGTFEREYLGEFSDRNGMSSVLADITGDHQQEIFVTNINFPRDRIAELEPIQRRLVSDFFSVRLGKRLAGNNLLTPSEDGSGYDDIGGDVGLAEGGWGWGAVVEDLDSDGQYDVLHGTQNTVTFDRDNPVYSVPMTWVQQDGEFYRQNGTEIGFGVSDDRGVAQLDYEVTGALDVVIGTYDEEYLLYRNDGPQGNSLQVVVDAGSDHGTAIGAELYATVDGDTQFRQHNTRTDYQSQNSRVHHIGLGDDDSVDALRIVWPDGTERTFDDIDAGQRIRVTPEGIEDRLEYRD